MSDELLRMVVWWPLGKNDVACSKRKLPNSLDYCFVLKEMDFFIEGCEIERLTIHYRRLVALMIHATDGHSLGLITYV